MGGRVEDEMGMGGSVEKTLREWLCAYPESFVNWQEVSTRFVLLWNHVSSVLPLGVVTDFSLCLTLQGLETRADWKQKLKQTLQHGSNSCNTQDNLLRVILPRRFINTDYKGRTWKIYAERFKMHKLWHTSFNNSCEEPTHLATTKAPLFTLHHSTNVPASVLSSSNLLNITWSISWRK